MSLTTLIKNSQLNSPALLSRVNFGMYRFSGNSRVCSLMFPKFVHTVEVSQLVEKVTGAFDPLEPPATDSETFNLQVGGGTPATGGIPDAPAENTGIVPTDVVNDIEKEENEDTKSTS